jgi:hypothetical protein
LHKFRATNVAEDIVKSEFIEVSTEGKADSANNDHDHVVATNEIAGVSPTTIKKTADKNVSKSTKPNEDTDGSVIIIFVKFLSLRLFLF